MKKVLDSYSVAGFRLSRLGFSLGTVLPCHAHPRAEIGMVIGGVLAEASGGARAAVGVGGALLRPAGRRHSNVVDEAHTEVLCIEVEAERWQPLAHYLPADAVSSCELAGGSRLHGRLLGCLRGEAFGDLALEGTILELLAAVGRSLADAHDDRLVQAAQERIEGDPSVSTAELAASLGADEDRLRAAFGRKSGASLDSWRLERRLSLAERLVTATSHSLARIAAEAGFYDQAHMVHAFRRHRGFPPSALRRRGAARAERLR